MVKATKAPLLANSPDLGSHRISPGQPMAEIEYEFELEDDYD